MRHTFARMMSLSLSLASLSLLMPHVHGLINADPRILIIGGVEAPADRYPYAVALKNDDGNYFCGGSLISQDVVLTAAHCIYLDGNFTIAIGRQNLTKTDKGDEVTIAEKIPHPNYDMQTNDDYDFGLVFLSRPTVLDVDLVHINTDNSLPLAGTGVTYLGWGEIDSNPSTVNDSQTLMEVETYVITNEQCEASAGIVDWNNLTESYEGQITEHMLCTFAKDKDSCQEDSGGPLIVRGNNTRGDLQVGVASWGISCATDDFPGVAARISSVHRWIEENVCSKSIEPGPQFKCVNATLLETYASDQADTLEEYTAHSVATNSLSTKAVLGIGMFALVNLMLSI